MNQSDIVVRVAEECEMTKAEATNAVTRIVGGIQEGLERDEEAHIHGLGTFRIVRRAARKGRNPQTGEAMTVPARRAVKFKPSADWKRAL